MAKKRARGGPPAGPKRPPKPYQPEPSPPKPEDAGPVNAPSRAGRVRSDDAEDEAGFDRTERGESDAGVTISGPGHEPA